MAKTYDVKCYDLAKDFLSDEDPELFNEKKVDELAQTIQTTIEDYISSVKGEHSENDDEMEEVEGEDPSSENAS